MGCSCKWLGIVDADGIVMSWNYSNDSLDQQVFSSMEFKESLRIVQLKQHHVLICLRASPASSIAFAIIGQQVFELESFLRSCLIPATLQLINDKQQHMDRAQAIAQQTKIRLLVGELLLQGRILHTNLDDVMRAYNSAAVV